LNFDEAGFSYVTKASKVMTPKVTKRMYEGTTAEKGKTSTVLASVNAAGQLGHCAIILKGQKFSCDLKDSVPVDSCITVPKDWHTNNDTFIIFC
jgi:hypothetical protein